MLRIGQNCAPGMAPCHRNVSECVATTFYCNGVYDCSDSSDEEFCNRKFHPRFSLNIIICGWKKCMVCAVL